MNKTFLKLTFGLVREMFLAGYDRDDAVERVRKLFETEPDDLKPFVYVIGDDRQHLARDFARGFEGYLAFVGALWDNLDANVGDYDPRTMPYAWLNYEQSPAQENYKPLPFEIVASDTFNSHYPDGDEHPLVTWFPDPTPDYVVDKEGSYYVEFAANGNNGDECFVFGNLCIDVDSIRPANIKDLNILSEQMGMAIQFRRKDGRMFLDEDSYLAWRKSLEG